ncbi:cytochrome P450 [Microbacterium nymphoidis]|uniref:cytochrome P450 n=1 Tax=Microbacterium nymphoidis TaxID=2898586 RepID=UPI001E529A44|nr:cytochrome P450 [Microbacterium nymphoidis]MCD2499288.1 cytochrome P450 [Microbacterium nymphoidis]
MDQTSRSEHTRNPRPHIDDAWGLLVHGYRLSERVWSRVADGARAAPMRLLGKDAVLVRGAEGVELFYDAQRIARHGAMPAPVQEILFGHGSVHSLDGTEHRHRKAAFVDVAYDEQQVHRFAPLVEEEWRTELTAWQEGGERSAYDAAVGAFGRAVMRWAGVPGTPEARTRWARRLAQIVDGFGTPYAPGFVLAAANRWWSDRHAAKLIAAVRSGRLEPRDDSALKVWAWHRDANGALLPERLAGVELQNTLRPMVAVARFVAFAARDLHDHPSWRARIARETRERGTLLGGPLATAFAQEVRRTAPFVPMLPGWALQDTVLDGQNVAAGGRVVLDIRGTDSDGASWADPGVFRPERFVGVADYEAIAAFIPHGGADVATGHRCPGEKLAIAGLTAAVAALSDPGVRISDDGLDVNLRRLPTRPASGGRVRRCPIPLPRDRQQV